MLANEVHSCRYFKKTGNFFLVKFFLCQFQTKHMYIYIIHFLFISIINDQSCQISMRTNS